MANIKKYTLKNGAVRYEFKIYLGKDPVTGKDKQTTRRGFKTRKEAQIALKEMEYELLQKAKGTSSNNVPFLLLPAIDKTASKPAKLNSPKKKTITFEEIYNDWVVQYETTVQPSTFAKTVSIFRNHILPKFGNKPIDSITVEMCQRFINTFPGKLKKFKDVINYSSHVFEYALKRDYIVKNPMKLINRPKPPKKINEDIDTEFLEGNFYTTEELWRFLEAAKMNGDPIIYTFFYLLAYTGMRKGEALALKWKDIDYEKKLLKINKALSYAPNKGLYIKEPKNGKNRNVYLDDTTLCVLKEWKEIQSALLKRRLLDDTQQIIFHNFRNTYQNPATTNRWIKMLQKKFNLRPITTHGLRHTHCTLLLEAGIPPREVMERLGHLDLEITMKIYAHVTEKAQNETAEKFVNYLNTNLHSKE